jgi:hypothetical protein
VVADNAGLVNDKLGEKYGDYARTAARSSRKRPPSSKPRIWASWARTPRALCARPFVALGIAAVAGFLVARAFTSTPEVQKEA